MPTQLMTVSLPARRAGSSRSSSIAMLIRPTCPTSPLSLRNFACAA
jgi:hypothetical protein